jgi:lipoprotein-anchoring transpeptidase ErfK/SrfK
MRRSAVVAALGATLALAPAASASTALGPGATGKPVAAVQSYLATLGYLPWKAVTGRYDDRTYHAVIAFQGWSKLPRDGYAGFKTRLLLKRAHRPVPWKGLKGKRLEVHIDRQVVLLVKADNTVWRAIHVSTGADGKTPTGSFHIERKEEMSWSNPFSVWLPWASYFTDGFAFHEYPDVPTYAASHGCIRMPHDEAPTVYGFATLGLPAYIRDS